MAIGNPTGLVRFRDRTEAGKLLAKQLETYKGDAVIFALPRGGVVLAAEIAKHLGAPLDLIIPRKIGHPANPEFAICAVTESGDLICNEKAIQGIDPNWLNQAVMKEKEEAHRRRLLYQGSRPSIPVEGKTAIIVDDGIATGLTMLAAIHELQRHRPSKIIVAVPVVPPDTALQIKEHGAEIVALNIPRVYQGSVGSYYDDFNQVEDDEVINILNSLQNDQKEATNGSRHN